MNLRKYPIYLTTLELRIVQSALRIAQEHHKAEAHSSFRQQGESNLQQYHIREAQMARDLAEQLGG